MVVVTNDNTLCIVCEMMISKSMKCKEYMLDAKKVGIVRLGL